jgi:hypothetical protein
MELASSKKFPKINLLMLKINLSAKIIALAKQCQRIYIDMRQ